MLNVAVRAKAHRYLLLDVITSLQRLQMICLMNMTPDLPSLSSDPSPICIFPRRCSLVSRVTVRLGGNRRPTVRHVLRRVSFPNAACVTRCTNTCHSCISPEGPRHKCTLCLVVYISGVNQYGLKINTCMWHTARFVRLGRRRPEFYTVQPGSIYLENRSRFRSGFCHCLSVGGKTNLCGRHCDDLNANAV